MVRIFFVVLVCILAIGYLNQEACAQQRLIKGIVTEAGSEEPLASVTIIDSSGRLVGTSNRYGYFNFAIERSTLAYFSMVGYERQGIFINRDTTLSIAMKPQTLQQVEVRGVSQQMSNLNPTITRAMLNNLPSIGGERDLLKAISLFSGVLPGSELSSGINVRGGANDQNLFYLDGAPIYSTGHLFGFLSLFNPDAIQKVDFYKSNFPVEFGGRLSSITDVTFREGNKAKWEGEAEAGVISSKLVLEGPLITNKTSVLLAARSAYLNLFNLGKRQAVLNHTADNYFGYNFYDLNFKLNHVFNPNNKIFLSFYQGQDDYETLQNSAIGANLDQNRRFLANKLLSLRSFHVLGKKLFLQTGLHTTRYAYRYREGGSQFDVEYIQPNRSLEPEKVYTKMNENINNTSGDIQDLSGNLLVEWLISPKAKAKFGAEIIRHRYQPLSFQLNTLSDSSLRLDEPRSFAVEGGYFGDVSVDLPANWKLNAGGRYSSFHSGASRYGGFEPRVSLDYRASDSHLQVSAARMIQYNHALIKSGGLVDKTMWVPSTDRILPQTSWQYSAGWWQANSSNKFTYHLGAYFKQMENLSTYQHYIGDPYVYYNWKDNTLSGGKGVSYGVELSANKNLRRWDLGLNYTLSWSKRKFTELNDGEWFNFLYDRRHSFNANGLYKINKTTKLSILWVYYSGQRYNAPAGRIQDNHLVPGYVVYDGINNGKIPDYHRMDVSLSKKFLFSDSRFLEIGINIYNLYYHRNTYKLYVDRETITDAEQKPIGSRYIVKSASVFPILPSLNIRYKFK